jgi:hypothetical protein
LALAIMFFGLLLLPPLVAVFVWIALGTLHA